MFLKLNEGFTEEEKAVLETRLEKYRDEVASLKSQPSKLSQKLDQLKPEIVRVIKKKRTTNSNKTVVDKRQDFFSAYSGDSFTQEEFHPEPMTHSLNQD